MDYAIRIVSSCIRLSKRLASPSWKLIFMNSIYVYTLPFAYVLGRQDDAQRLCLGQERYTVRGETISQMRTISNRCVIYVLINIRVAVEPILRIPRRPGGKESTGLKNGTYPEQFHSGWLINLTVYSSVKSSCNL